MPNTAEQIASMVDMLPDSDQHFALEFMKKLVLAWDPDYIRSTMLEKESMEAGYSEILRGEGIMHNDIKWD